MSNSHGGRKIRINFERNNNGELCFEVCQIAYPHSDRAKRVSGCGEWVVWKQKGFHRPAQAVEELVWCLLDLGYTSDVDLGKFVFSYWASDMNLTKDKRLGEVNSVIK